MKLNNRLHQWALKASHHRFAVPIVLLCTFLNSSVLPVPQDLFIVPLLSVRPKISFTLMTLCVVASTLGGVVGYIIGFWFYDILGQHLISIYGHQDTSQDVKAVFDEWGALMVLISAITPFPYKVITISAGFLRFDFLSFMIFSMLGRMVRFYAYAILFHFFGDAVERLIEKWFLAFVVVGMVLGVSVISFMVWGVVFPAK